MSFYTELAPFSDFAQVASPEVYADVPGDWWVLLTDVRGSTKAIEGGRYKDVNALGASVIMAVHNLTGGMELPFVFGGDGATVLVPPEAKEAAARAGAATARMAQQGFDLELRVGLVPVADLAAAGQALRVARYQVSPDVTLAMLSGGGAALADRLVKSPETGPRYEVPAATTLDPGLFAGFECRWRPVHSRHGRMLTLLVIALGDEQAARGTYTRVLEAIGRVLDPEAARPSHPPNTSLTANPPALATESRMRTGVRGPGRLGYQIKAWLMAQVGRLLMATGRKVDDFDGRAYLGQVVANTDFRKFDDAVRMVVDVSPEQRAELEALLAAERERGTLAYGIQLADAALMTCLVPTYDRGHLHFVDGADGGYALAAKQLKAQLAGRSGPV